VANSAVLLEQADAALNGVPPPVGVPVEGWWPPAARAAGSAVGGLIRLDWGNASDRPLA
jgi:hypothetical protein